MHDGPVVADLAQQEKAAVAQAGDSGQRRLGKPLPPCFHHAAFEAELFRAAQHLGNADRPGAELVPNLRGIDAQSLKAQEHDQRG